MSASEISNDTMGGAGPQLFGKPLVHEATTLVAFAPALQSCVADAVIPFTRSRSVPTDLKSPGVTRGKDVAEAIGARVFDPDTAETGAEGDVFSPNPAIECFRAASIASRGNGNTSLSSHATLRLVPRVRKDLKEPDDPCRFNFPCRF